MARNQCHACHRFEVTLSKITTEIGVARSPEDRHMLLIQRRLLRRRWLGHLMDRHGAQTHHMRPVGSVMKCTYCGEDGVSSQELCPESESRKKEKPIFPSEPLSFARLTK